MEEKDSYGGKKMYKGKGAIGGEVCCKEGRSMYKGKDAI